MNYNKYFPGHQIAMPQPLTDGAVTYADGTQATLDQEAHDVATFLAWASEPELEERHRMGVKVDAVPDRAHRHALRVQAQGLGRGALTLKPSPPFRGERGTSVSEWVRWVSGI